MAKLAVDVVLLPPKEIMEMAIRANRSSENLKLIFRLNTVDCLPHLSLFQGIMDAAVQDTLMEVLRTVVSETKPLKLSLVGTETLILSDGLSAAGFEVKPTTELLQLHKTILKRTEELIGSDASEEMFYNPPIRQGTIEYVRTFRTKKSGINFRPHITTAVGGIPSYEPEVPVPFVVSELALCHLGNAGTCRKVLASFPLKI